MPLSRVFEPITALARKCKPLLWLMLVSGLMGIAAFMEPVDLALLTLRNKIRAQPVSGEVVVVGIDDESIAATGPWPWNRARLAALTDDPTLSRAATLRRIAREAIADPGARLGRATFRAMLRCALPRPKRTV